MEHSVGLQACCQEKNDILPTRSPIRDSQTSQRERPVSCKIHRVVNDENAVVLLISGRIVGEFVDVLQDVLEREPGTLALDLKDVLLVDRKAIRLLVATEAKGCALRNCPLYVREWVTREREEGPAASQVADAPSRARTS